MSNNIYDVIIIGSGMGGLATGLTLQNSYSDLRTIILEQHTIPGGYVNGFKRKGYYFDSGAEGIIFCGEGQVFKNALEKLGVEQEFLSIDPVEVLQYKDKRVTMHANAEKYKEELIKNFPDNKEEIEKYFEIIERMQQEYLSTVKDKIKPSFNQLLKIVLTCPTLRKYKFKSFKHLLDEYITNDQLKQILAVHSLWPGRPPESISAISAGLIFYSPIFHGHYYPRGGMLAFANNLAKRFVELGGEIQFKKKVVKILMKRKRAIGVKLSDDTVIKGKSIVSNADLKKTVLDYVGRESFPKSYVKRIESLNQSFSGFTVFLGLDIELENYTSHIAYNIDAEQYIKKVENEIYEPEEVLIRIPSKIDSSLKNDKGSAIILLSIAPYKWKNIWNVDKNGARKNLYLETKEEYANKLIEIAENVIPELSKHIVVKVIATPLTFERYTLNTKGAWYGPKRAGKKIKIKSPIKNLVFAGANVDGAGVPTSFFSGIRTATSIIKKLRFNFNLNPSS
ncbi:MAG: phytoene desaturase family protein [Candidatus Heimdallarchaeaceae archaeon]